jgi:hypothetical protein
MPPKQFQREPNGTRFSLKGGMNTTKSIDLLSEGEYCYLQNIRAYLGDRIKGRATQGPPAATTGFPVHTIRRLNDTTPAGPVGGFVLVIGAGGSMYVNSSAVASGFTTHPVAIIPFRPNTSVQPWGYVGSDSQAVTITASGFVCDGMLKIRSDGLTRKMGIAEPQAAPTVTFPGGGSGPSPIFYFDTYYASETGAESNPGPVSIPGTNAQANPSATQIAATAGVINPDITVNAAQYEGSGTQIRTKGGVSPGTITDYIVARGFGFTIPANVTIDGIQIDLNWVGQNSGTGVLSGVQLNYLGGQLGAVKLPGIQNQSFSTDTLQGGNGDTWDATLTPGIMNDPTFGFGVQITTQNSGGSDRSFINSMSITVFYSTQNANIVSTPSLDPQVDKINHYRQGGGLANPTFIGQSPNTSATFNDQLSDLAAATNRELEFDNFEPFPSIDLPRKGVINVTSNVLTYVSGDHFNIRWLPGTIMLIGNPTQVAYSAVRRPVSSTSWDFTNNDPTVTPIPNGTNLVWNIAEPILAAQPLPSLWGPTDNTAYMFGCYDPLRPGTLYYTKGNNPDSAPDTNQIEVTSPSEPLMNGVIVNGIGMVFSTERAWLIYPTFTTALATVSGVEGQAFNLQESISDRGLYIRPAICTEAGKRVFFRAKDGIYVSVGGAGSTSITDSIYNLFPHEGFVPQAITLGGNTVYPPDDTQPELHRLSFATGYLYYDYPGIGTAVPQTLVYDVEGGGWIRDVYQHPVGVHALEEGPNINGTLVGTTDDFTVRPLVGSVDETATSIVMTGANNAGDARANKQLGDIFLRALVTPFPINVAAYNNQFNTLLSTTPPTLNLSGVLTDYILDFSSNLGQQVKDVELLLSWPTQAGSYLDLWQPDFVPQPEATQDRPTDWDDLGGPGNKFVQGALIECDTFGVAKAIAAEDDLGNFHTPLESPITRNGQGVQVLTFSPPFTAHLVRITTSDGVPWRVWPTGDGTAQFIFKPYPEASTVWTTEATSNGLVGYQHCYQVNLAYIATANVVLSLVTDEGTFSMIFPPTSAPALQPSKILVKCPRNKWKVLSYSLSSAQPFYLWKELTEVWLKPWGSQNAFDKHTPFGGESAQEGAEV